MHHTQEPDTPFCCIYSILPFAESFAQSDTLFLNKYTGLEWYLTKDSGSITLSHHSISHSIVADTLFINMMTSTISCPLRDIRDSSARHSDLSLLSARL
jgi:hypothetical protein